MADIAKDIPVDGSKTLFRPGSTSKLFTWTAVMQLVEQGQLDLDADVTQYITQFQIPATFAGPVTLRNIMTHTAGRSEGRRVGKECVRTCRSRGSPDHKKKKRTQKKKNE